jgi:hypothetical protein
MSNTNMKIEYPECYTPEENNPYPLCIGNGSDECNECCIYVDFYAGGEY